MRMTTGEVKTAITRADNKDNKAEKKKTSSNITHAHPSMLSL